MSLCLQESVARAVGPTLPGGLVVRIRRSHRRGPGSIPGQGSLSSSSLYHLHFPPRSLLPNTSYIHHTPRTRHQAHTRSRTLSYPGTRYSRHSCTFTLSLSPRCPFFSHITTPDQPLCSALLCSAPTHRLCPSPAQTRCLPWSPHRAPTHITSGPFSHAPGSHILVHSWGLLSRTPSPLGPQMDHLQHTQSMHRMHHMLPGSFHEDSQISVQFRHRQ